MFQCFLLKCKIKTYYNFKEFLMVKKRVHREGKSPTGNTFTEQNANQNSNDS